MLKKSLYILLGLLLPAAAAVGQDDSMGSEGTIYSEIGVGMPADLSTSTAEGLGVFGVSFIEPQVPSLSNPAQWGFTDYGIASGGFGIRNTRASDRSAQSSSMLLSATDFQIQLPLLRQELGISAAFYPSSRSTYRFSRSGTRIAGSGADADTLQYELARSGSGGINNIELGLGWRINDYVSVGYAPKLVFASVRDRYSTTFDSDLHQSAEFTLRTSGSSFGHRFGTYMRFLEPFGDEDRLSFGATVDMPVSLDVDREEDNEELVGGTLRRESGAVGEGKLRMPATISGGVTYAPNSVWAFTSEALYQNWEDARYSYSDADQGRFTNRIKIGAGMRYHPFEQITDGGIFTAFKYRLGASYDTGHLTIDGRNIETLKFTGGVGISSVSSGSTIDIGFYYGLRGTESQNLVKEKIWGLRLSLNLAELVFTRPRLE